MKRVLAHVGYPKAASTTLQNGLFLQLHRQNAINFLGRAFESRYYGAPASKRGFKNWTTSVIEQKADDTIGPLSDSALNFLSEGLFMMNERHNARIATPGQLRDHFASKADRLDVLLILRTQTALIPSYYVQNHRRMKGSFSDFLAGNIKQNWTGEGKIFNFYEVVKAYADALGRDHVHPVLFEDFVSNKDVFSAALASAMDLPADLIRKNLGEDHLNQTRTGDGVLIVRKHQKGSLRDIAIKTLALVSTNAANKLRTHLPAITDEERRTIFETFKDSNRKLAEEFSLDQTRMREYGYF